MKGEAMKSAFILLVAAILLTVSLVLSFAKNVQPLLPRAFMSIYLGMPEGELLTITGKSPGDCLGECSEEESFLSLKAKDIYLSEVNSEKTFIDIFLINGRVNKISLLSETSDFSNIQNKIKEKFNSPAMTYESHPKYISYVWKDNVTIVKFKKSRKTNKIFSMSIENLSK